MRQKMKGLIGTVLAFAKLLTTVNVNAAGLNEQADTVSEDQDVKIELIQNDKVVESGTNELKHTRNYTRSSSKTNGDEIVITPPEGVQDVYKRQLRVHRADEHRVPGMAQYYGKSAGSHRRCGDRAYVRQGE